MFARLLITLQIVLGLSLALAAWVSFTSRLAIIDERAPTALLGQKADDAAEAFLHTASSRRLRDSALNNPGWRPRGPLK